jgi:hypothetical protein
MRNTEDNDYKDEQRRTVRKSARIKSSGNAAVNSPGLQQKTERQRPTHTDQATCSPVKYALTEDEFRARVSRKAYELYEKRTAATQVDDWLEAERLVKHELLAEGRCAGSV